VVAVNARAASRQTRNTAARPYRLPLNGDTLQTLASAWAGQRAAPSRAASACFTAKAETRSSRATKFDRIGTDALLLISSSETSFKSIKRNSRMSREIALYISRLASVPSAASQDAARE